MTKKALSRAGLEPVPLGAKDIPSELPFILIMTLKKERRERTGSWRMLAYQAFTPPVRRPIIRRRFPFGQLPLNRVRGLPHHPRPLFHAHASTVHCGRSLCAFYY